MFSKKFALTFGLVGFPATLMLREVNNSVRSVDLPPKSLLQQHVTATKSGYVDSFTSTLHVPSSSLANLKDLGTKYAQCFFSTGLFQLESKILAATNPGAQSEKDPASSSFKPGDTLGSGTFKVVAKTDDEVLLVWSQPSSGATAGGTWLGIRVLPADDGVISKQPMSKVQFLFGSSLEQADDWLTQLAMPLHVLYSKALVYSAKSKFSEEITKAANSAQPR